MQQTHSQHRFSKSIQILDWIWRELRVSLPAQLSSAWFLSTLFGTPLVPMLISVACVGLSIQIFIEAGRYSMSWYLRRHFPRQIEPNCNWPGWIWMAPWGSLSCLFGFYFGTLLGNVLNGVNHDPAAILLHPQELLIVMTVIFAATTACLCFIYVKGRMASMEINTQVALRSAAEHQLKLLESQLDPHMLFNTLANLRVLIGIDPAKAQDMVDQLSDFMRASLASSRSTMHPLKMEFERLADYLSLIQIRMGERLQYKMDLPEELCGIPIPTLLLQALVENAIKHGIDPKSGSGCVSLLAKQENRQLILIVRDTGVGIDADMHNLSHDTHFGLQQVRERLLAVYGSHASMTIAPANDAEGGTEARLTLPLEHTV